MSRGSNEVVIEQEKNQKWYTEKCAQCGENTPVRAEEYGKEPHWCDDCKEKLFSPK